MSRSSAFLRVNEYISRMELYNLPKDEPVPLPENEADEYTIALMGRVSPLPKINERSKLRGHPVVILR